MSSFDSPHCIINCGFSSPEYSTEVTLTGLALLLIYTLYVGDSSQEAGPPSSSSPIIKSVIMTALILFSDQQYSVVFHSHSNGSSVSIQIVSDMSS